MKRSVLFGVSGIVCIVLMVIKCTPQPSDPSENPEDASVDLFFPNGIPTTEQGKECQIGLKIELSHHIDSIEISSPCNEYYQAFPLISENRYDTFYFTPVFETEGYCTLYVRASLNSEIKELKNHLIVQVLPSDIDTMLNFSTIPEAFTTHTGAIDTVLFTLNYLSDVAYKLNCSPALDSTELHLAASAGNGTSRVHFDPDQPGDYIVALLAEVGTHSVTATVAITVLPSFTPLSVEHPDTLATGILDTIIYMLSPEQIAQGMRMGVSVDENFTCGTVGVYPVGSDSLLILVNSPYEGTITFSVITNNEIFSDTLSRTLTFIDDSSAAGSDDSFTTEATEGVTEQSAVSPSLYDKVSLESITLPAGTIKQVPSDVSVRTKTTTLR